MADKDFFLSPDDAQTLGDIDYMRKAKRTRRTFPKTLKNKDGFAIENEVSSVEDRSNFFKGNGNGNNDSVSNTVFNPTPSSQSQPSITGGSAVTQTNGNGASPKFESSQTPQKRRQQDNSMDMFRNMAKSIRKR